MTAEEAATMGDLVAEVRRGLVCERCGKYVGSLAGRRYLPPPYPVALDRVGAAHEAEALIGFELHMIGRLRRGNFVIRHPQRDGRCVGVREWLEAEADDELEGDEGEA